MLSSIKLARSGLEVRVGVVVVVVGGVEGAGSDRG